MKEIFETIDEVMMNVHNYCIDNYKKIGDKDYDYLMKQANKLANLMDVINKNYKDKL